VAEAAAPRNINEFILPPLALEVGVGPVMGYVSTMLRIQAAFEKARIQFTEEDESGGIGVRLQKKKRY
jgi:hypothetical protein